MRSNNMKGAALLVAGLGVGSLNPAPEPEQLPAPPAEIKEVEKIKEVRFEALTDRADKSIRDALGVETNADVVKLVSELKMKAELDRELKLKAADQIKRMQANELSARQQYEAYQAKSLEGSR